jgi:hypothetical protein
MRDRQRGISVRLSIKTAWWHFTLPHVRYRYLPSLKLGLTESYNHRCAAPLCCCWLVSLQVLELLLDGGASASEPQVLASFEALLQGMEDPPAELQVNRV